MGKNRGAVRDLIYARGIIPANAAEGVSFIELFRSNECEDSSSRGLEDTRRTETVA